MNDRGILYGVGVGPGDPELMTIKVQRIISEADVIAVPDKVAGEKTALHTAASFMEGKSLLLCDAPMARNQAHLEAAYIRGTERGLLDRAASVENCIMDTERIYPRFASAPTDSGYFSVVMVNRDGE